jgi:cobalt-zinc-cadmium efflux system membrane fusion protein
MNGIWNSRSARYRGLALVGASILAVTALRAFAHGGVDDEPPVKSPATGVTPQAAPSGNSVVTLPKESQFAFQITTEPVLSRTLAKSRGVTGIVVPRTDAHAEMFPPQSGRVNLNRPLKIGDRVTKGQQLFTIEQVLSGTERLSIEREIIDAKRDLDEADRDNTRKKSLAGVVAQKDIELASIRLKSAKERYAALQQASTRGTSPVGVVAPISGIITQANLVTGEFADVSKRLLEITDVTSVWVEASVYQGDLKDLPPTATAMINIPSSSASFTGTLVSIGSTVDPESKTVKLIFAVNNPVGVIKIGENALVQLNTGSPSEVLSIAKNAIVNVAGVSYVFVHTQPEQFIAKEITIGSAMDETHVEVQSGLEVNERVVITSASVLRGKLSQ